MLLKVLLLLLQLLQRSILSLQFVLEVNWLLSFRFKLIQRWLMGMSQEEWKEKLGAPQPANHGFPHHHHCAAGVVNEPDPFQSIDDAPEVEEAAMVVVPERLRSGQSKGALVNLAKKVKGKASAVWRIAKEGGGRCKESGGRRKYQVDVGD
ncbi:hypothetical protein Syun_006869 [Stephania yunnanensis]|uniref:Uncharacterized protein n=1 Tax=Stephania yunnanensis TaxID=152371 RepID=A0AAP0KXF5_9MAGN